MMAIPKATAGRYNMDLLRHLHAAGEAVWDQHDVVRVSVMLANKPIARTMRTRIRFIVLTTLLSLLGIGTGCGQDLGWSAVDRMIEQSHPTAHHLSTDSLATLLADSTAPQPILLDTRPPEEYRVSHLQGARRLDPDATTFPMLNGVPRDTLIVAYCSVGYRSSGIVERLQEAGFTNVYNLKGSIFRWANEGRPVYRDSQPVKQVHPYDRVWGQLLDDELRAYAPR
jgi:rhodanese-related sulfurtransferase